MSDIDRVAKVIAGKSFWEHMPKAGRDEIRKEARAVINAMNKWQPIESAPKETRVLTFHPDYGVEIAYWGKTSHIPIYGWNHGDDPDDQNIFSPTHWMPLPAAPDEQDAALAEKETK